MTPSVTTTADGVATITARVGLLRLILTEAKTGLSATAFAPGMGTELRKVYTDRRDTVMRLLDALPPPVEANRPYEDPAHETDAGVHRVLSAEPARAPSADDLLG